MYESFRSRVCFSTVPFVHSVFDFFSLSLFLFFCINFILHDRSTQTEVYRKAEVTK